MSSTDGDAVPARSSHIAGSPQGTPDPRLSVDRSPCAAWGLLGVSPHSGGPEVRLGKRRRGTVLQATGSVIGPGVTPISPFAGVLGASPLGVARVRDAAAYGGVYGGLLLPPRLLPRRLDYAATIPLAPVWSHAVGPPCPAGGGSLSEDCSHAWRCPTVLAPRVVGAAAGSSAVPPQAPFVPPDFTPPVDDVDSSAAVGAVFGRQQHPHAGGRGLLGVSPYASPDDMRSAKRSRVLSLSPSVVVTPGGAIVQSPLPPLLSSPACPSYTPIHPLSDFDVLCYLVLSLPLRPRRLEFVSNVPTTPTWTRAAQPFLPPPVLVGRDGLDSIPLEECSQSSTAVFASGGSALRDGGGPRTDPRVQRSCAAAVHGQGGVLDDFVSNVPTAPTCTCATQPFLPPPVLVGRDGLDSIPIEECSLSPAAVFASGGSMLRDGGGPSTDPRVQRSCAATVHGQGGVLDDSRPYHDRPNVLKTMHHWKGPKAPDAAFVEPLFHATVTAGMTYTVLNNVCIALGVAPVRKPTFYCYMRGEANVREGWNAKTVRQDVWYCDLAIDTVMRSGKPVTYMVDGRYDSARSAQHCTFTAIEYDNRLVVGVHTLRPKTEGTASNQLEAPAVVRLLRGLLSRGLQIRTVVSDDYAASGPQLGHLSIEWQKDCHHKMRWGQRTFMRKGGDPCRLPLYTRDEPVYEIIWQTLGKHCSTTACSYYTEFCHTSTVETFQGTIIIYVKKALHFGKSYEPRLTIVIIRWNSHAWQDPVEYRTRRPSGTSIRPRPSYYRHNHPPQNSWVDLLLTFILGSHGISDWARRLLEYDDCDVVGEVGSSTPSFPRDFFCGGEETIARDENAVDSGADPDVVGDNNVFIIGVGYQLPDQQMLCLIDRAIFSLTQMMSSCSMIEIVLCRSLLYM
ncbi:hypothetical protein CBR_g40550 [Chara braunii]|uniref:Uncharacterized protein n=1 Tax=Chara braunii TaxID=69332 RepID=A0A388K219_CHABU|nr:hypothetical protein CBR_g40550 [Chara braunii]|eukprot:GBG64102.1 hypothetical protein CBR_g40550 [Chara braunii]